MRSSLAVCIVVVAGCGMNLPAPRAPQAVQPIPVKQVRWEEQFNQNQPYEPHGPPPSGSAASNENLLQGFLLRTATLKGEDKLVESLEEQMRAVQPQGKDRVHQVLAAIALIRRDTDTDEALKVLIAALEDKDEWVARFTAQMLPRLAPASLPTLPALAKASNRTDQAAQSATLGAAAFGLEGVPHLIEALRDQDPNKPVSSLWTSLGLAEVGPLAVPSLVEALASDHANVRFGAAFALGRIGQQSADAEPALIALLADPEPFVRAAAAEALQRINCRSAEVISGLVNLTEDTDERVRAAAALAIGVLGKEDERASGALVNLIDDPATRVRRVAVQALGELGPAAKGAWPRLVAGYQEAEPLEKYGYAQALLRIDQAAAAGEGITLESLSQMPVRVSPPGE
jgi:HEAT repeat protein